jgi:hypothetical protein
MPGLTHTLIKPPAMPVADMMENGIGEAAAPLVKPSVVGNGSGSGGGGGVNVAEGARLWVAAVATHSERYFPLLTRSCARLGVHMTTLGWREKMDGYAFRLRKALEFCETLPEDDVVMVIDAFDVVLLQGADMIMKKFLDSGAQMIVAKDGEHPNYVVDYMIRHVFCSVGGGVQINIGTFIGRAGFVRDLMKELFRFGNGFTSKENDQELLSRYLAANPHLLEKQLIVDHQSDLFLTLYGGHSLWLGSNKYRFDERNRELELHPDGALRYVKTDAWPCVLHGPANSDLTDILHRLNLRLPENPDRNYTSLSHARYMWRMLGSYVQFYYTLVMQIVAVVCALLLLAYVIRRFRNRNAAPPTPAFHWTPAQIAQLRHAQYAHAQALAGAQAHYASQGMLHMLPVAPQQQQQRSPPGVYFSTPPAPPPVYAVRVS